MSSLNVGIGGDRRGKVRTRSSKRKHIIFLVEEINITKTLSSYSPVTVFILVFTFDLEVTQCTLSGDVIRTQHTRTPGELCIDIPTYEIK